MKIFDKIREDYRKNKVLFFLKYLTRIAIIYTAIQLLFTIIADFSAFWSGTFRPYTMTLFPFFVFFLLGLLSIIEMYEMSFNKENKKFKSLCGNAIANFSLSLLLFFVYNVSISLK